MNGTFGNLIRLSLKYTPIRLGDSVLSLGRCINHSSSSRSHSCSVVLNRRSVGWQFNGLALSARFLGTAAPFTDTPIPEARKEAAKIFLQSKQNVPHFYITVGIEVDNLIRAREQCNKQLEKEKVKLTVNDFIIKAAAMACLKVPQTNSAWMDNAIRQYNKVDVNVIMSAEAGFNLPVVFSADSKGILEIHKDVQALGAKIRDGKLQPKDCDGGTITVSNLGMFGVHQFTAFVKPPQSCILAVASPSKIFVPVDKDKGKAVTVMYVTLSCDHRTVDGALGAQWLQHFKSFLSKPETMSL